MSDDLHHLAAAYALDALDDHERVQFEAHYPSCESCAAEIADFRDVAASLAAAEAATPPPDLRSRVLDEIDRTAQVPPIVETPVDELASHRKGQRWGRLALAAAATVALIAGIVGVVGIRDDAPTTEDIVSAPDAVVAALEAADGDATVQIVWSPDRDEVAVIADGLRPAGPGRQYALWFVIGDQVAPAALFVPDDNGDVSTVLQVDDLEANGWGISIEPAGGSPQPTTPILFVGSI